MTTSAQTVPCKSVATFTPLRWDSSVFGSTTNGTTTLKRQFDYFYKFEKASSELAASRYENNRLVGELVALKRRCQELQSENFQLKESEKLAGSFFNLGVGSAFAGAREDVFTGWLATHKQDEPKKVADDAVLDAEDEELIKELDEYLEKN